MARRSKYKFALLNVDEEFKIEGIDVYSMLNSLTLYNKRNNPIKIEQVSQDPDQRGRLTFKRIA